MVLKTFCDVCGNEIPDTAKMEHNEAVTHPHGHFTFGAVVVLHHYDRCESCGVKVANHVESMILAERGS